MKQRSFGPYITNIQKKEKKLEIKIQKLVDQYTINLMQI